MNYYLQGYDKDGNPTSDKRKIVIEKFPPEYAHIIGVPFKMFKGGKTEPPVAPVDLTHIAAIPDRQAAMEIDFPNVVGYRIENYAGEILFDFSKVAASASVRFNFPAKTAGRSIGVRVTLVQTPCRSGWPSGVRGIAREPVWLKSGAAINNAAKKRLFIE